MLSIDEGRRLLGGLAPEDEDELMSMIVLWSNYAKTLLESLGYSIEDSNSSSAGLYSKMKVEVCDETVQN